MSPQPWPDVATGHQDKKDFEVLKVLEVLESEP
jgi:hypothetical protein